LGEYVRIQHDKIGGLPKWKFGCPLVYPALDYARAYRENMESWVSKERALRILAWQVKTEGGAPAISAWQAKLKTALGANQSVETNPAPAPGSVAVTGKTTEIDPIKTSGLQTSLDQSRRVLLMVCAAFGLPETFFGDASVGALATAESLDRPTELMCLNRQEFWRQSLQRLARYALKRSAGAPGGKLREAQKIQQTAEQATINVSFPDILDHDVVKRINAIVQAVTLGKAGEIGGIDEKTAVGLLLQELNVEDWQKLLDLMYPEGEYEIDRTKIEPPQPVPVVTVPSPRDAKLAQAVEGMREAALVLSRSGNGN
jgi:hypothetical protein